MGKAFAGKWKRYIYTVNSLAVSLAAFGTIWHLFCRFSQEQIRDVGGGFFVSCAIFGGFCAYAVYLILRHRMETGVFGDADPGTLFRAAEKVMIGGFFSIMVPIIMAGLC